MFDLNVVNKHIQELEHYAEQTTCTAEELSLAFAHMCFKAMQLDLLDPNRPTPYNPKMVDARMRNLITKQMNTYLMVNPSAKTTPQ